MDFDQGGIARRLSRTYLGPSIGWLEAPNPGPQRITAAGTYNIDPATTLVTVNVAVGAVTLNLPSAIPPLAVTQPGLSVQLPITVVDTGGHAFTNPITIAAAAGQNIAGGASVQITTNFGGYTFAPFADQAGYDSIPTNTLTASIAPSTTFATRALAVSTNIPVAITAIITLGYTTAGDGGGWTYFKTGGSTPGGFQSADGAWWALAYAGVANVLAFGAVGDNTTDNATPFANAYSFLTAHSGGVMFIPAGKWKASSFPTIAGDNITILGTGNGTNTGTQLVHTSNGSFITVTANYIKFLNLYFEPSIRKTSGYEIDLQGAGRTLIEDVRMTFGYNGLHVLSCNAVYVERVEMRQMLGTRMILFEGTISASSQGLILKHVVNDNGYNNGINQFKTWAQNTAFNVGDVINVNGVIWNCQHAGTSSNVGTGPSGFPAGSTPGTVFSGTVADGTVQWSWAFQVGLAHVEMGNYTGTCTIIQCGFLDAYDGVIMTDNANTGSSYPLFLSTFDCEIDHAYHAGMYINNGESVLISNMLCGSTLTDSGVQVNSGFRGELCIGQSTIGTNAKHGIAINGVNPQRITITGCSISLNSELTHNTYNGINITDSSNIAITGNAIGNVEEGEVQQYGVALNGAADYISITGNILRNVTGQVFLSTTGTHNIVQDNPGYNPVGVTAAANVGASPATITAGPTRETHYVNQSATNTGTITKSTRVIHNLVNATTLYVVELGPNESYVVNWSTTQPTFVKDVH